MKLLMPFGFLNSPPPVVVTPDLFDERFEGTGTPAGWFVGGGGDPDSTVSPMEGAQSLRLVAGAYVNTPTLALAEFYLKFRMRISALPGSTLTFLTLYTAGFAAAASFGITATGALVAASNPISATTAGTLAVDTVYDVEIHYKAGGGTNGIVSIAFALAGAAIPVSGAAFAGGTNAVTTDNVEVGQLQSPAGVTTDIDVFQGATFFLP